MITEGSPALRRRRLAAELRRLREAAALSGVQVAEALRWSTSKISRLETGQIAPSAKDVARLLDHYEVDSRLKKLLLSLAYPEDGRSWWEAYADVIPEMVMNLVSVEAGATRIRSWQATVVPGLLQTREYATAITHLYQHLETLPPGKIERRTRFRMRRQELLTESQRVDYYVVLDESVLLRQFGDEKIMRNQLYQLIKLGELPNIHIRVLRLQDNHPTDLNNFLILEFPTVAELGPLYGDMVYTESFPSYDLSEDEEKAYKYSLVFDRLVDAALEGGRSMDLIASHAGL